MQNDTSVCPFKLAKVLVCTDDSPQSHGAIKAGVELGRTTGCQVHLLQVLELAAFVEYSQPEPLAIPPQVMTDLLEVRQKAARENLSAWQAEADRQGVRIEIHLRVGANILQEILEVIEELKPELILMGRRGHSGISRLLLGSISARVVGHSPVNVLLVPQEAGLRFEKLLVASDGSPFSALACREAMDMAERCGSSLLALVVAHGDLSSSIAADLLTKLEAEAEGRRLHLKTLALEGRPYEVILEVAQQQAVDLIILGSHGRTGLKRLLMGSVAERVAGQARCPVLVVKGTP